MESERKASKIWGFEKPYWMKLQKECFNIHPGLIYRCSRPNNTSSTTEHPSGHWIHRKVLRKWWETTLFWERVHIPSGTGHVSRWFCFFFPRWGTLVFQVPSNQFAGHPAWNINRTYSLFFRDCSSISPINSKKELPYRQNQLIRWEKTPLWWRHDARYLEAWSEMILPDVFPKNTNVAGVQIGSSQRVSNSPTPSLLLNQLTICGSQNVGVFFCARFLRLASPQGLSLWSTKLASCRGLRKTHGRWDGQKPRKAEWMRGVGC